MNDGRWRKSPAVFFASALLLFVMPGLAPGIHVLL
jgi:hypothetical protein